MLKHESFPIAKIYVPVKRRATLRPEAVREIAENMLEIGQATPTLLREDDGYSSAHKKPPGVTRAEVCQ
jgi:hypothetical protein